MQKFYGEIIKTLRKTGFNDERVSRLIILLLWNELKRFYKTFFSHIIPSVLTKFLDMKKYYSNVNWFNMDTIKWKM